MPLWTSNGQGGRPEGFKTETGTKFTYIGKPFPGWDGIVRCEVLAVEDQHGDLRPGSTLRPLG